MPKKNMDSLITALLTIPVVLAIAIGMTIVDAFILLKMWQWFFVTSFALPALSLAAVIGIAGTFNFLKQRSSLHKPAGEKKSAGDLIAESVGYRVAFFLFAYVVSLFL